MGLQNLGDRPEPERRTMSLCLQMQGEAEGGTQGSVWVSVGLVLPDAATDAREDEGAVKGVGVREQNSR